MSQALRKLTAALARSRTCAVFINQIREKIGVMFGNPETTTGGRALKFYSSIRLDIRRVGGIKGTAEGRNAEVKNADGKGEIPDVGNRVRVKVVKNKLAPPFRIAEFDILFDEGISAAGSILDLAVQYGIIEKKGAWFSYGSEKLGQGRETVREDLKTRPQLLEDLKTQVLAKGAACAA
jgi:recombination protein RecA